MAEYDFPVDPWCLTLPESFAEATDFKAEEAIELDLSIKLPEFYSLGEWIYETSNQGSLWSCFDWDAKILMWDNSYELIKNIKEWDIVYTYEWQRPVSKVFQNWQKEMLEIKLKKLRWNKWWIKCTYDHKFYVYKNWAETVKQANELNIWDMLLSPIYNIEEEDTEYINIWDYIDWDIIESADKKYLIYTRWRTQSMLPKQIEITDNFLELLWYYVAEWNINYCWWCIHWIWLTFHQDEKDKINFCINELSKITNWNWIYTHQKKSSKAFVIKVNNTLLWILFENLFSHLCYNKTIPEFIYKLPIERFRHFLHALVLWDWYITGVSLTTWENTWKHSNEIWISLTAHRVMNIISNKLYYNNISHSIEIRNNGSKNQKRADIYWIYLYWNDAVWLMPELLEKNEWNWKKDPLEFVTIWDIKYVARPINSIENIWQLESYNIEVEWNHTYCVNNIKVHNCTSMWTTHATQILNVKKWWVKPTNSNIITPDRKDLRSKMWHSTTKYDGWDYVEKAVNTALKEWIKTVEKWDEVKFDWYAYWDWERTDKWLEMLKRYIYNWNPVVWCIRWDSKMRREMSAWEIKSVPTTTTWWHCIAVVWFDAWWFWFINSWTPNDNNKRKSRFYVSNTMMKKLAFNWRYWILYMKIDAKVDPEYLKRKNTMKLVLEVLKKQYDNEPAEVKNAIVNFSQVIRKTYPEINQELKI